MNESPKEQRPPILEYIPSAIKPDEISIRPIWDKIKAYCSTIKHGLVPHKPVEPAEKSIINEELNLDLEDNYHYTIAFEAYNESTNRIKFLEEKAIKLLTYISALSAILFYFLNQEIIMIEKILISISLFLFFIAILVSLRCVGIKSKQTIFLNTLLKFENDSIPKKLEKVEVLKKLLDYTIYNQTIGNNLADIIKSARLILYLGILSTFIAFIIHVICSFFFTPSQQSEQEYNISFSDTTLINTIQQNLIEQNQNLNTNNKNITDIIKELKNLNSKIDSIHLSMPFSRDKQTD